MKDKIALKHLEILNEKMSEVAEEANSFANRYLFGGMVAVIALINTDLLVDEAFTKISKNNSAIAAIIGGAVILSTLYFSIVADRIRHFRKSYRSAKHKYEVTLYMLLIGNSEGELPKRLEESMKKNDTKLSFPESNNINDVIKFLHDHHARKKEEITIWRDVGGSLLIVILAIAIKLAMYVALPAAELDPTKPTAK